MNIFLVIKCGFLDAYNFISQISQITHVEKITVFRDSESLKDHKVNYIIPGFKRITLIKLLIRLLQIIKRKNLKPGIIIGIYEIPHGLLAVIAGKILKVPSAVSIIGNPAYTKLRKNLRLRITMWILRNATFVTVTGTNSKKFLVTKGIADEKVFVLPNTLEFNQLNKVNKVVKAYDIISLGRISNEKHVEIIVQIIAKLKKEMPAIKAAIAGSGPELNGIKTLVKSLELQKNIDIQGYIPDEQLESFFNNGRVFVLTSETEGFPRTIVQAAACGIPVIASKVGDISDVIDHELNGFLVDDYLNIEEYAGRVMQLLNDDELYRQFSVNLNKKVREQFVTEKASEVWGEMISKISMQEK